MNNFDISRTQQSQNILDVLSTLKNISPYVFAVGLGLIGYYFYRVINKKKSNRYKKYLVLGIVLLVLAVLFYVGVGLRLDYLNSLPKINCEFC